MTNKLSTHQKNNWIDKLYQSKLEKGFQPRLTAILPDRPQKRVGEVWGEVYDYDTEFFDYPSSNDKKFAELYMGAVGNLIRLHGVMNIFEIPLPREFLPHAHPDYDLRCQRLIMARAVSDDESLAQ